VLVPSTGLDGPLKDRDALRAKLAKAEHRVSGLIEQQRREIAHWRETAAKAAKNLDARLQKAEAERDELRAKLDAIHRYVADRADEVDGANRMTYPNAEARIWQEFFGGKEPDA